MSDQFRLMFGRRVGDTIHLGTCHLFPGIVGHRKMFVVRVMRLRTGELWTRNVYNGSVPNDGFEEAYQLGMEMPDGQFFDFHNGGLRKSFPMFPTNGFAVKWRNGFRLNTYTGSVITVAGDESGDLGNWFADVGVPSGIHPMDQ